MHNAAYWGQPRAVQLLLRLGADLDQLDGNGKSVLDIGRERGQQAIITLLVNVPNYENAKNEREIDHREEVKSNPHDETFDLDQEKPTLEPTETLTTGSFYFFYS